MNLTQAQIDELTNLRDTAREAGIENPNNKLYADAYDQAFSYFSIDENTPVEGIDFYSWVWLQGAKEINRGQGAYSEFIREYTALQYETRTGQAYPNGVDQIASNKIADAVITDIIESKTLPNIDQIAIEDANNAVIDLTGDKAVWSGNLLFLLLNHDLSFNSNLLETSGSTYDILLAFQASTITGGSFNNTILSGALFFELLGEAIKSRLTGTTFTVNFINK